MKMSVTELWIITWRYRLLDCGMWYEDVDYWIENYHMKLSADGLWNATRTRTKTRIRTLHYIWGPQLFCFATRNLQLLRQYQGHEVPGAGQSTRPVLYEQVLRPACDAAQVIVPSVIHGLTTCDTQTIISIKSSSNKCRKRWSFSSSPPPTPSAFGD
jgi:hypothetical protein